MSAQFPEYPFVFPLRDAVCIDRKAFQAGPVTHRHHRTRRLNPVLAL
jgi:hypothetical protein